MARRVYNATTTDAEGNEVHINDKNVFAPWKSKVEYGGEKLTPEQMFTYRTRSGRAGENIREALAQEEWFNNLSGQKQTEILKQVNTLVNKIGLEAAGYPQDDKKLDAYKQGIPTLLNTFQGNAINSDLQAKGISPTSNAGKEIKAEILAGNKEVADQKAEQAVTDKTTAEKLGFIDSDGGINVGQYHKVMEKAGNNANRVVQDIPKLQKAGLDRNSYDNYINAIDKDKSLTAEQFAKTYNEINTNKSDKLTQKEMLAFLIKNYSKKSYTQTDLDNMTSVWNTYSDGTWKKVPYIKKDGTIGVHNAQ